MRQLFQKLHTLGFLRRLHYFLIGSIQTSKTDIFQQGGVKQVLILSHIGNAAVQCLQAHITKFLPANGNAPFLRVIVVDQQFCKGALARTGFTNQGSFLSCFCHKGNIVEDFVFRYYRFPIWARLCRLIRKGNMIVRNVKILSVEIILSSLQRCRI